MPRVNSLLIYVDGRFNVELSVLFGLTDDCDRYCGRQGPPTMMSTNNVMMVVFVTDRSITSEGFAASYTTVNATACRLSYQIIHILFTVFIPAHVTTL